MPPKSKSDAVARMDKTARPIAFQTFLTSLQEAMPAQDLKRNIEEYLGRDGDRINDLQKVSELFKTLSVHAPIIQEAISIGVLERLLKIIDDSLRKPGCVIRLSDVCGILDSISKISDIEESPIIKKLVGSFFSLISAKFGYLGHLQTIKVLNALARIGVTESSFGKEDVLCESFFKKIYQNVEKNKDKISNSELSFLLLSLVKLGQNDEFKKPNDLIISLASELKERLDRDGFQGLNLSAIDALTKVDMVLECFEMRNLLSEGRIKELSESYKTRKPTISYGQRQCAKFLENYGLTIDLEFPLYRELPSARSVDILAIGDLSLSGTPCGTGAGDASPDDIKPHDYLLLEYDGKTHENRVGKPNATTRFRDFVNNLYAKTNLKYCSEHTRIVVASIKDEAFFGVNSARKKEELLRSIGLGKSYLMPLMLEESVSVAAAESGVESIAAVGAGVGIGVDTSFETPMVRPRETAPAKAGAGGKVMVTNNADKKPGAIIILQHCLQSDQHVPDPVAQTLIKLCDAEELQLQGIINKNQINTLKSLIKNGLDIDLKIEGKSLLKIAIDAAQYKVAAILMIAGLRDEAAINIDNIRFIHAALSDDDDESLNFLHIILMNFNHTDLDINLKNILNSAITKKHTQLISHILTNHHSLFSKDEMQILIDRALMSSLDNESLECLVDTNHHICEREGEAAKPASASSSTTGAAARKPIKKRSEKAGTPNQEVIAAFTNALFEGNCGVVEFLIGRYETLKNLRMPCNIDRFEKGSLAMVYAGTERGYTYPLLAACELDNDDLARLLIDKGADLHCRRSDGGSALLFASGNGNLDIVNFFIAAGVDINVVNNSGLTPLTAAAGENHAEVVRKLMAEPVIKPDLVDIFDNTAFAIAAHKNSIETLEIMLSYDNVDVHLAGNNGLSPLEEMVSRGYFEGVKLLLGSGRMNPIVINNILTGTSKVRLLTIPSEILFDLLSYNKLDLNQKDLNHLASIGVINNHKDLCTLALEKGANALTTDKDLGTLDFGKGETAPTTDGEGNLLFNYIIERRDIEFAMTFLDKIEPSKKQAVIDNSLIIAASCGRLEMVELLLSRGANQTAKDSVNGATALIFAAQKGHDSVVELLLAHANEDSGIIDNTNRCGETALIIACKFKHGNIAGMLADAGADLLAKDEEGKTFKSYATLVDSEGCEEADLADVVLQHPSGEAVVKPQVTITHE